MALARGNYNRTKRGRTGRDPLAIFGGVVLLVAFLGVFGVYLHISSAPSDAGVQQVAVAPISRVEILVPTETLDLGTSFQPAMFHKDYVPEEQTTGEVVRSFDELKGMYAKGILVKNQPILKSALTDRQPVHILTAALPRHYRAVALKVTRPLLDNVDGWAQPGTDVDLVWLTEVYGKEIAAVLAGPIRVLASNKSTEGKPAANASGDIVTVTLLVTVRDAIRISLAALHGKLTLGLRGQGDRRPSDSAARPISSVLEEVEAPEAEAPKIEVKVADRNSGSAQIKRFDLDGRPVEE